MITDRNLKYRGTPLAFGPYDIDWALNAGVAVHAVNGAATDQVLKSTSKGDRAILMPNAGDLVTMHIRNPKAYDWSSVQYCQVVWASEAAAVGDRTATWKAHFYSLPRDGANTTDDRSTVSSVTFTADAPSGTAGDTQATGWQEHGGLTFADGSNQPGDNEIVVIEVEMDDLDAALTEDVYFLEFRLQVLPQISDQPSNGQFRDIPADPS